MGNRMMVVNRNTDKFIACLSQYKDALNNASNVVLIEPSKKKVFMKQGAGSFDIQCEVLTENT